MSSPEIEIGSVHYTRSGVEWLVNDFDVAVIFTFVEKHNVTKTNLYDYRAFLVIDYIWHEDMKRVKLLSLTTNDFWWVSGFTWLNWFTPVEGDLENLLT